MVATTAAVLLTLSMLSMPAQSQGLFDQGKDLLKGLGGGSSPSAVSDLTTGEIAGGLRDALRVGAVGAHGDGITGNDRTCASLPDPMH